MNIPNIKIEHVEIEVKTLHFYCKIDLKESQKYPSCGKSNHQKTPKHHRKIRDLDISGRKVFLHLQVHQFFCDCGRTYSESFDFVQSGKSYTKRQAKWVFEMSAKQSHIQVGALLDMSHKTVE